MITEDYVSFETAKLLKEKGFNWECETRKFYPEPDYDQESPDGVYAPTLQMAMKWLRKKHNLIIVPNIRVDDKTSSIINCYIVGIWYVPKNNGGAFCYTSPTPYNGYPSYEAACEAAIKYCLENLI